jgi:Winged helix-turn-helix DNA-binding
MQKSDLRTFPISAGLLDPRHVQAIDSSSPLWVYLWLLNRVTRDDENGEQFDGIVLHGRPVSIQQIADELGIRYRACRRHLSRLVDAGYVVQKKTGVGMCTYTVTKSKRWAWKRRPPTDQKVASGSSNPRAVFESQAPNPQAEIWPLAPDPQATFGQPTDQKVASAERGTRARSHTPQRSTPITKGDSRPAIAETRPSENQNRPVQNPAETIKLETRTPIAIDSVPPDGLNVYQLARGMMDALGFAGDRNDLEIWSRAISLKAKHSGMPLNATYQYIFVRAKAAKDRGEFTKPTFWIKDGCYDPVTKKTKGDEYARRVENDRAILRRMQSGAGAANV